MGQLYAAAAAVPGCLLTSHLAARHVVKYPVGSAQVEAPLKPRKLKCTQDLKQSQITCCQGLDTWGAGSTSQLTDQQIP